MPYGYYYRYWDPTYILVIIGVIISLWASAKVKTTYSKYSRVRSMSGLTGAQAAERILHSAGLYDVRIEHISGDLTDHYDPKNRVLRLSDTVYGSASVAAVGVAAHECGHAFRTRKITRLCASVIPWFRWQISERWRPGRLLSSD